jgi:hypothetical protein
MMTLVFGTVLPWLLIAVGARLGNQLVRESGRILLRLEAIERQLGARTPAQRREPGGLPVGTVAPDFELPDLVARVPGTPSLSQRPSLGAGFYYSVAGTPSLSRRPSLGAAFSR